MPIITSNVTFGRYIECYYWYKNTSCFIRSPLKCITENDETSHKVRDSYSAWCFPKMILLYINGTQHGFKKCPSLIENGTFFTIFLLIENRTIMTSHLFIVFLVNYIVFSLFIDLKDKFHHMQLFNIFGHRIDKNIELLYILIL